MNLIPNEATEAQVTAGVAGQGSYVSPRRLNGIVEPVAAALAAHIAETGADDVHGATASNTANMIVRRNADGTFTVSGVALDTAAEPTAVTGMLRWNDQDKTAELVLENGVVIQIGQEQHIYARNTTGSTLAEGVAVRIVGAAANRPQIVAAQADSIANSEGTIGLVTQTGGIGNNANGYVATFGFVRGLDTSAFSEGDELWLSPTVAGALTATRPTAEGQAVVRIGYVVTASNNGSIFVAPHFYGTTTGYGLSVAMSASAARTAIGANDASNLDTGTLDAARLPDEIDARIQVLSGTDAALATELLALGELAAPNDGAWIRKGDGVTAGGVRVGSPTPAPVDEVGGDFYLAVYNIPAPTDGADLGGSGTVGVAGFFSQNVQIAQGSGGANSAGSGNGGNGGYVSPLTVVGGAGGAANGSFNGGSGGSVASAASPSNPNGAIRMAGGSGGNAGAGGNGGSGGGFSTFNRGVIRVIGGSGGNGGSAGAGGSGGGVGSNPVILATGGNGGNGDAANGGNGGSVGFINLSGGNGSSASGATAGANGGASGSVTLSGSAASGATAGAAGGSITTAANGNRAGGSISTAAGASFAGGSIDLSNGGNSMTIQGTAGQIGHRVAAPVSSASAGAVGQWASDDNYAYFYGATGWRRVAGATF